MRCSMIWALAPFLGLVDAFKDTSPFFLLSTSELLTPSQPNVVSASDLSKAIVAQLETCPSDAYVIISQPGVRATDFADKGTAPLLKQMVRGDDKHIRSSVAVSDVLGSIDVEQIGHAVKDKCGAALLRVDARTGSLEVADEIRPRVIHLDFSSLPKDKPNRGLMLAGNDAVLSSVLSLLPYPKYTIIYTTTPGEPAISSHHSHHKEPESDYQMDSLFQSPVHMDLKRDLSTSKRDSGEKLILPEGPLFERYSFLSPGLFMGILVAVLLLSILYVGISAIAGLQVTYAAFDKEMGPAAQKKVQ